VERARQGQRDAESKLSYTEARFVWFLLWCCYCSLQFNTKLPSRSYTDLKRFRWRSLSYYCTKYYVENLHGNLSSVCYDLTICLTADWSAENESWNGRHEEGCWALFTSGILC
jgi:hypothetical protein